MDIHHVALWVGDIERTASFYCDTIGLEKVRDKQHEDGRDLFVRGETDHQIQLKYEPERQVKVDRSQIDHLAIVVDDVDAVVARVRAAGGTIDRDPFIIEEGALGTQKTAFVSDPDGYLLALVEVVD